MHTVACIESCRAVDNAVYAVHNQVNIGATQCMISPIFCFQDTNECVCAGSGDAASFGQKQGEQLCRGNDKYVAWTISSFPASKSCGDLYYQKQVYVPNNLLVSIFCSIDQMIYHLIYR